MANRQIGWSQESNLLWQISELVSRLTQVVAANASSGVVSFNTRAGDVTLLSSDVTTALTYSPVTNARTLTINGVSYNLSVDRSWTIDNIANDLTITGVLRETITTNRQTASYTLALTDRGKLVEMNVATANNLTVPLNSSIAFPIGSKIDLSQYGAGQTTVVATGGVTIRSAGGALKLALQYSGASLVKIATDEWYLFGDITV